jgi:hypothetical protein
MRIGKLQLPPYKNLFDKIYDVKAKSGSRFEYSLSLTDELKDLGRKISDLPLKFASLVLAVPGQKSQNFHSDNVEGERAIVYMEDVLDEKRGPIEFKTHGKVFGKAGTFAHYEANEIHRGVKAGTLRYALALAFSKNDEVIETVGVAQDCNYKCPFGYKNKDCTVCTRDNCCKFDQWPLIIAFFIIILGFGVYKKYKI